MPLVNCQKDGASYAKYFSNFNITGTIFIAFRDLPTIIKKYVSGTVTLDYGSGAGRSTRYLKSLGLDVDGVDINPEMIKYAEDKDPKGNYNLIASAEIPANDSHYDLVFSSWVFGDVSSKQELLKIMKEITRVLKADGTLIAIVANVDSYSADLLSVNTEFEENKNIKSGSTVKVHLKDIDLTKCDTFWSEGDYRETFEEAGLSIVLTHNPLGKDEDGYAWADERVKSMCTIYVAKKMAGQVFQNNGNETKCF